MEYPGSRFTRPFRLAMLGVFVVAWLVSTPLIIARTAGYRYDWRSGLLKETGGLSIDEIEPRQLTVQVNAAKLKKSLPLRLNRLSPRRYQIQLSAPGYYEWLKEVVVESKQTVYLKQFRLIKKDVPQLVAPGNVVALSASPDGAYLAYAVADKNGQTVWLRQVENGRAAKVWSTPQRSALKINWAPTAPYLAVGAISPPRDILVVIKAGATPTVRPRPLATALPITRWQWGGTLEPLLYYHTTGGLWAWSPQSGQTELVSRGVSASWFMAQNQLWMVAASATTTLRLTKDVLGFPADIQIALPDSLARPAPAPLWQLYAVSDRNEALLKQTGQPGLLLSTPRGQYALPAEKLVVSPFGSWWLLWGTEELWTYSSDDEPRLLSRSGEELRDVAPLDRYNTLALLWPDRVTALFPYYFVAHELMRGSFTQLSASPPLRQLFAAGTINKQTGLWALDY